MKEARDAFLELAKDFPPVIEDRALEAELRLCLARIAQQHWRLHA